MYRVDFNAPTIPFMIIFSQVKKVFSPLLKIVLKAHMWLCQVDLVKELFIL